MKTALIHCLATLMLTGLASADSKDNLARAKGTAPFGSDAHGPFAIHRINDGRTDRLGMWNTNGLPGSFIGVKLGDLPVTFNTIRFYLFNGRGAFKGWSLQGFNDCHIDEDTMVGTVFDPEIIASDPGTAFINASTEEHNVVTITFKPVSYRFVRIFLPNKSRVLGLPEMLIYNRTDNLTPRATVTGGKDAIVDDIKNTITIPKSATVSAVMGRLAKPEGVTLAACGQGGKPLEGSDTLSHQTCILAKCVRGGGKVKFETEYKLYSIIDASRPAPKPKPYAPSNRPPPPPKPLMTPASAPKAPKGTVNLVHGKKFTASIDPEHARELAKPGRANWFARYRYPQWFAVDLGKETEFDYIAMRVLGQLSLQRFWIQISGDGRQWGNLVEVNHVRKNVQWNGYFPKTRARHVRVILIPPSFDVHVNEFVLANLAKPIIGPDRKPAKVLKPTFNKVPDFSKLPPAAKK